VIPPGIDVRSPEAKASFRDQAFESKIAAETLQKEAEATQSLWELMGVSVGVSVGTGPVSFEAQYDVSKPSAWWVSSKRAAANNSRAFSREPLIAERPSSLVSIVTTACVIARAYCV
jgi:hypothetical protein